jgi:hypothetical protein
LVQCTLHFIPKVGETQRFEKISNNTVLPDLKCLNFPDCQKFLKFEPKQAFNPQYFGRKMQLYSQNPENPQNNFVQIHAKSGNPKQ